MKPLINFARATLIGGLLFLAPIMALFFLLGKALALAHKVVKPLAARLPAESIVGLPLALSLAVGLLVLLCFLAGLFARTVFAGKIVRGLEDKLLSKVPGYSIFKSMGESMLGAEKQGAYPVVWARFDDSWQLGLQVEVLANGLIAVYIPGAPVVQAGSLHFLEVGRVTKVDVPLASAMKCLQQFGGGSRVLLRDLPTGSGPISAS